MPGFPSTAPEDLQAVIAYVKSLSCRGQLELDLIQESEDNLVETDGYDSDFVVELADQPRDWAEVQT